MITPDDIKRHAFYVTHGGDLVQVVSGIDARDCGSDDGRTGQLIVGVTKWDDEYRRRGDVSDWVRQDNSWEYCDQIAKAASSYDIVVFGIAQDSTTADSILNAGKAI